MNKNTSFTVRLFRNFQPNQFSPPQLVASDTYLLTKNNLFISSSAGTYLVLDTSQEESYKHWTLKLLYHNRLFFPSRTIQHNFSLPLHWLLHNSSIRCQARSSRRKSGTFQRLWRQLISFSDHGSSPCGVQRRSVTFNWNSFGEIHLLTHSCFIPLLFS